MKLGILLAAYGSRNLKARESFTHIEARVKAGFPGVPVRWAFTSAALRRLSRSAAHEGAALSGAARTLDEMAGEGFSHVAVQSLHVVPGGEYRGLERTLAERAERAGSMAVGLGRPLLAGPDDVRRAAGAVFSCIPAGRSPDQAVVLLGHGTAGAGNELYGELLAAIRLRDPNLFVGLLGEAQTTGVPEDSPLSGGSIRRELAARGLARAYLLPLLTVAGEHVRRDMAGDGPRSWKTALGAAGIACEPVMRGAAECDEFLDIWLDHLRDCVAGLAGPDAPSPAPASTATWPA